jgi:hypothetical protein
MKINQGIIAVVAVLIILFPVVYSVFSAGYAALSAVTVPGEKEAEPFPEIPKGTDGCVADRTYMRFHHMDLLKELREDAVRKGIRGRMGKNGQEITFDNCMKCHGSREQACAQCHREVNLRLNCFRCHFDPGSVRETGH